jgi:UDP-N-acetylglucosamine enolpyruvyl transferase
MIRNPQISLSGTTAVAATCQLEQVITDANAKNIDNVYLYLNQTSIVDGSNYIARTTLAGSAITDLSNVALSVNIPASLSANGATGSQSYVYARIGVKISGVEDLLFSPVVKVDL